MEEHLWLSLAIPAAFMLITGVVKSLVRGGVTWANFYLGLDAALAALANGIVNVVDIVRENECIQPPESSRVAVEALRQSRFTLTGGFIAIAFAILLFVMLIHQRWEHPRNAAARKAQRVKRGFWMGFVANALGRSALLVFIYMRLKGTL